LQGTGVDHGTKVMALNPDISYNYWNTTINNSKNKIFSIQNSGTDSLSVTGLSLIGSNAQEFSISAPPAMPCKIGSGGIIQFDVTFTPTTVGDKQADLKISNNSDNSSPNAFISLIGNGTDNGNNGGWGSLIAYEYWFDADYVSKVYVPGPLMYNSYLNTTFQTTGLNTGLHNLHIRFKDNQGQWSSVVSDMFHKLPLSSYGDRKITAYEYWFDNADTARVFQSVTPQKTFLLNAAINADSISIGLHNLHIRYQDDAGQWSSVVSDVFHKLPLSSYGDRKITAYEYWFDNDYATKVAHSVSPQQTFILNEAINVDSISIGLHNLHIRYQDDAGQWSSVVSDVFHKLPLSSYSDRKITAYEYWFDNDYATKVAQSVSPQQTFILNSALNVNSLPLGLHNFHIRYKDDSGQWSSVNSEVIFKVGVFSAPTNLITSYRYWFDMNNSAMVNQTLPTPVNPYELVQNIYVGYLPVGNHSIHFQFKDISGQWSSVVSGQFAFTGPAEQQTITSQTITNGQSNCYDALQTITVAGNGATFIIQTGGSANMIAGQNIIYFPNTTVQSGGYLHGQIAPGGPFCLSPSMPAVLKVEEELTPMVSAKSSFKIYPNPTTGSFILELSDTFPIDKIAVEIYGMHGDKILSKNLYGERKHEFSLTNRPVGVYFLRVISDNGTETAKIIKQ